MIDGDRPRTPEFEAEKTAHEGRAFVAGVEVMPQSQSGVVRGRTTSLTGSLSPTLLLRISDGDHHMHRSFNDFQMAVQSAEAFADAGFRVSMISATGRFLMGFEAGEAGRAGS